MARVISFSFCFVVDGQWQSPRMGRLGRLSCSESVDGGCGKRLAADGPVAAFDFIDFDPGNLAQVFAFDFDHGVGDLVDHRALLLRGEHVFDNIDSDERHWNSPWFPAGMSAAVDEGFSCRRPVMLEDDMEIIENVFTPSNESSMSNVGVWGMGDSASKTKLSGESR